MKTIIISLLLVLLVPFSSHGFESEADFAMLVDYDDGTILYEKNPDARMRPASMSKLMTLYVLFDRLKKGIITEDTTFLVSKKAWEKGGSKMFVKLRDHVPVSELMRGIIVQSGNDACIVVAEGLEGSEENFVIEMNKMAASLGLTGTHFNNATGWPDKDHWMTIRDLVTLSQRIIKDFPEYYPHFSDKTFTYNGIKQYNRNSLINKRFNIDGLKTGHTEESGYGIVISGREGTRRLIGVLNGIKHKKNRAPIAEELLQYGFRSFAKKQLFLTNDVIEQAEVWFGADSTVGLVPHKDISLTLPKHAQNISLEVNYLGPIKAPITRDQPIAELHVNVPNTTTQTIPLYPEKDVQKLSFFGHIIRAAKHYVLGS
jgi:D-alanyl-D-alanine carboxypeptidase (penicillin-binding protein 5/6)